MLLESTPNSGSLTSTLRTCVVALVMVPSIGVKSKNCGAPVDAMGVGVGIVVGVGVGEGVGVGVAPTADTEIVLARVIAGLTSVYRVVTVSKSETINSGGVAPAFDAVLVSLTRPLYVPVAILERVIVIPVGSLVLLTVTS